MSTLQSFWPKANLLLLLALLGGVPATAKDVDIPSEVAALKHQFVFKTDDKVTRLGEYPTYVLIERNLDRSWKALRASKQNIDLTASNQEVLLVSNNYTNVVPAWEGFSADVSEDPATGERKYKAFYGGKEGQKVDGIYNQGNSFFAFQIGQQAMPTLAGRGIEKYYNLNEKLVKEAVASADVLGFARAFNAGDPSTQAVVAPSILELPSMVWMIEPHRGGEVARYYFVPKKITLKSGDVADAGSTLQVHWVKGLMSAKENPIEQLRRFRVTRTSAKVEPSGYNCVYAYLEIDGTDAKEQRFCGYAYQDLTPFYVKSPKFGLKEIKSFEGVKYKMDGTKVGSFTQSASVWKDIREFRQVDPAQLGSKILEP